MLPEPAGALLQALGDTRMYAVNRCRWYLVISSTNISSHTSKPYVPQGEIICYQQDASAFTGRVGFEVFYPWLIFHPFLCCRPVSELPGAYTKDAERVRESFLVSGGSLRDPHAPGGSPAASIEAQAGPMWCRGAAPQQTATSRGDWETISQRLGESQFLETAKRVCSGNLSHPLTQGQSPVKT